MSGASTGRELFGRDEQITVVRSAITRQAAGFQVVLLTGQAGIGKTAIWEAGVTDAEQRGHAVLQTRACESEARLSHGGLGDLLEHIGPDVLAELAPPQRRAVDAALLRDDSGPIDPRALGAGLLAIVRTLAARGGVLIAIDDDQWLDAASTAAVAYALRRLRDEHVTVLLTRRTEPGAAYGGDGLAPHLGDLRAESATEELPPLRPEAIRSLLDRRVPTHLAQRVYELSHGNPFFALEIAQALRRSEHPIGAGDELPLPSSLQALVSARLAAASPAARRAVLVTSLVGNPRLGLIREVLTRDDPDRTGPDDGLDDATAAGLLVVRGDHVRLGHPLIGAVARAETPPSQSRHLHRIIADTAVDAEERARHAAFGAIPPDAAIADELARVADATIDRGGMRAAAELAEQAWRFTPRSDPRHDERLLAAVDRYFWAGLHDTGAALLAPQLPALPPGPLRARARLLLSQLTGIELSPEQYEEVLAEADPRLRAQVLAHRANAGVAFGIVPVSQGLRWTAEAADITGGLDDPAARAQAVSEAGWMEVLLGIDPEPRFATMDASTLTELALHDQGDRIRAVRAMWRGEMSRAQRLLEGLQQLARERGEELSLVIFSLHLFEAAIRVGDWTAAARIQQELVDEGSAFLPPEVLWRIRAAVAAGTGDRGLAAEALREVDQVAAQPDAGPVFWHHLETRRTAGQAALFDGDAETAVALLSQVAADAADGEYLDPGAFPVVPDLIEALVKAGRLEEARDTLKRLEETAAELDHPWARAGAARARGILLSAVVATAKASADAAGGDAAAEAALGDALDRYRKLGLPFDEARTLVALGTLRRRQRRFREARTLLQDAAERFERLGAAGLAGATRAEAGRVGGRVPERAETAGGLTATEQQVVDLVVAGCTNRQAADRLFISVSAVEAHLTRVYAKLGVSSRTQLVRNLSRPT
ncbi:transcriptional regulator [Catellatospora sp. TT07R-123]|uniref:helix-turn-helix transcriptional regulator n=1 Tax=Catellatospora sp. TT07R-123 TaxID=2733863 RepID=UPI001B1CAB69|nr:LuxR family transcriptional regulator [Catellatospora sp. TT07R-123]GHJ47153.1 transcriptional regulator [Catellatospora sp. TT07R-123]